ncbi:MAG: hypothetical protein ACFBZ9_18040 [Sphingomonadales bacterium]
MAAQTAYAGVLEDAISNAKPLLNARLRLELASQDARPRDAESLTLRVRGGFETGPIEKTVVGIEFEWLENITDNFNSTTNGRTDFPVVADPQDVELNRLYISTKAIDKTTVTLGRQRIVYDDARFVGDVIWRQNQQTYDAISVTNTSIPNLTVNAAYVIQVNRIFGPDSPQSPWDSSNVFLNAGYQTPIGKLTGFAYLLDIDDAIGLSTKTFGVRFAGSQPVGGGKVSYVASYARQSDYADNPIDFSTDYFFGELTGAYKGFVATVAYEVLGSDEGIKGFSTPLATAHKFQGFADLFLATPDAGIKNFYAKVGYGRNDVGPFDRVFGAVWYHTFEADFGGADYGDEIDFVITAKWKRFLFGVKYGEYNMDTFATDTRRVIFDVNFAY